MFRRTFKDIITFIPVVIILIIPLSPVGHVLVFGAIQRFFPDFFPSCFTEQRQNLLQLYETAEYSEFSIQENWKVRACCFLLTFVPRPSVARDAFGSSFLRMSSSVSAGKARASFGGARVLPCERVEGRSHQAGGHPEQGPALLAVVVNANNTGPRLLLPS